LCDNLGHLGFGQPGGFKEYMTVPESLLFKLPKHFSFEEGSLLEPLVIGVHTAKTASLSIADSVVVLGAGPIGLAMAGIPILARLALVCRWRHLARYVWVWGWGLLAAVYLAWPVAVWSACPGALDLWRYDVLGRVTGEYTAINQPPWYYLIVLPLELVPWTPLALLGFVPAVRGLRADRRGPHAFVLVWAVAAVAILSIPSGKHHHYLLSCLPAWAMLSSLGLVWLRGRLPSRAWLRRRMPTAVAILLAFVFAGYAVGHFVYAAESDRTLEDTAFLRRAGQVAPADAPLLINGDGASMNLLMFRIAFYLPDRARIVHNLTYLLDERIDADEVYVVARSAHEEHLSRYGDVEAVLQSERTNRERGPKDRLTLLSLRFREGLSRYPAPDHVTPMQAMGREGGPYLGEPPVARGEDGR
jgi:hypothetical protein